MIATTERPPLVLRLAAPLAWRSPRAIQTKLLGFAATEWGSALDMLRAAELTDDPRHRRLFLRHARDEARHADRFRATAQAIARRGSHTRPRRGWWPLGAAAGRLRSHEAPRADRQELFATLGTLRFLAFVARSELRAKRQFEALARHFRGDAVLRALFEEIARDEHVHATYSAQLLEDARAAGHARAVRRAERSVRWWQRRVAWRRAGKRVMDKVVALVLAAVFVGAVGPIALCSKLTQRARAREEALGGWSALPPAPSTLQDLERQA